MKIAIALCLFFAVSGALVAQKKVENQPTLKERVDEVVKPYFKRAENVGLSVALIEGDKEAYFNYGSITKDTLILPTQHTVYEIGSVTKVFTALLLAKLHEDSIIDINASIFTSLPDSLSQNLSEENDISFMHLATHTSGLPRRPYNFGLKLKDENNPYAEYTVEDLYNFIYTRNIMMKPSGTFLYSNTGYGLLGHCIENVLNDNYENCLHNNLFASMSMTETTILNSNNMSVGHDFYGNAVGYWNFKSMQGSAAAKSTTSDLAKFLKYEMDILNPNESLAKAIDKTQKIYAATHTNNISTGLGWQIFKRTKKDMPVYTHSGSTAGFRAYISFIKEQNIGVIVLANNAPSINSGKTADHIGIELLTILSEAYQRNNKRKRKKSK